jgi:hypothetical protein
MEGEDEAESGRKKKQKERAWTEILGELITAMIMYAYSLKAYNVENKFIKANKNGYLRLFVLHIQMSWNY